jgi:IS5 family transposase
MGAKRKLRTAAAKEEAQAAVLSITGQLAGLAERSAVDACAVLANARRALAKVSGRVRAGRAIDELAATVERARRVAAQTCRRLAGVAPRRPCCHG